MEFISVKEITEGTLPHVDHTPSYFSVKFAMSDYMMNQERNVYSMMSFLSDAGGF